MLRILCGLHGLELQIGLLRCLRVAKYGLTLILLLWRKLCNHLGLLSGFLLLALVDDNISRNVDIQVNIFVEADGSSSGNTIEDLQGNFIVVLVGARELDDPLNSFLDLSFDNSSKGQARVERQRLGFETFLSEALLYELHKLRG